LYKKYKLKNIKLGYRSFKILQKNNKLYLVNKILTSCCQFPLISKNKDKYFSSLSYQQYLTEKLCKGELKKNLTIGLANNNKKIIICVPKEWFPIIEDYGIQLNKFISNLYFTLVCFIYLGYGLYIGLKLIINNFKYKQKPKFLDAHFINLVRENLPDSECISNNFNVINWYQNKIKHKKDITYSFSHVDTSKNYPKFLSHKTNQADLPNLKLFSLFKFFVKYILIFVISFIHLLQGKHSSAFMFNQLILLIYAKLVSNDQLAKEYLFSNTSYIYKPLWADEFEKRGIKVSLYFYSANCQTPKIDGIQKEHSYGYNLMSWKNFYVWTDAQRRFVKDKLDFKSNIKVVGPIFNLDSALKFNFSEDSYIGVFDIIPLGPLVFSHFGVINHYYTYKTSVNFLEKIHELAVKNNLTILYKCKREFSPFVDKRYVSLIQSFKEKSNIIVIDSNTHANHIIKVCRGVISLPFTSTAIIAQLYKKPSIYFDPTKRVLGQPFEQKEIKIINDQKKLNRWLGSIAN